MNKHVWPLVLFTTMAQLSAGVYLFIKLNLFLPSLGLEIYDQKMLTVLLLIIALAALLISFSHLGSPRNAVYALHNIKSSWLSREIFFMSGFTAILFIEALFFNKLSNSSLLSWIISFAGITSSVLLIFSMIKLYRLETVPSWNATYTHLNFSNTALLSGIFLLILFNAFKPGLNQNTMLVAGMVLLLFQLAILIALSPTKGNFKTLTLILYGIILVLIKLSTVKIILLNGLTGIFIFLILCSAILIERFLFYKGYKNVGV